MTLDLESELRQTLAARAAAVPADSAMRMQTVDFHPRTTRFTTRLRVGSLAGAAAGTGAVLSVALIGGSQPAFAGWSPVPATAVDPAPIVSQHCLKQLTNQIAFPDTTSAGWTPVVTDLRGPYTFVVYQQGNASATCFDGQTFTVVDAAIGPGALPNAAGTAPQPDKHAVSISGSGTGATAPSGQIMLPPTGSGAEIENVTVAHLGLAAEGGATYTVADGQISSDVSGLTLQLSDGSTVQATTGGGWFVSWWPGSATVSSGTATTPTGQQVEQFGQWLSAPTPDSGLPCDGSQSAGGSAPLKPKPLTCARGTQAAS
jgi:hypothetical protein